MAIYWDMDGTIADLYGVDDWLDYLTNEDTYPYENAKALLNLSIFSRELHKLQARGIKIGIISWTSKSGSDAYNFEVMIAKRIWLAKHLPSIKWDEIHIIPYGTPKHSVCKGMNILFDDEEKNRNEWGEGAYGVENIIEIMRTL